MIFQTKLSRYANKSKIDLKFGTFCVYFNGIHRAFVCSFAYRIIIFKIFHVKQFCGVEVTKFWGRRRTWRGCSFFFAPSWDYRLSFVSYLTSPNSWLTHWLLVVLVWPYQQIVSKGGSLHEAEQIYHFNTEYKLTWNNGEIKQTHILNADKLTQCIRL